MSSSNEETDKILNEFLSRKKIDKVIISGVKIINKD